LWGRRPRLGLYAQDGRDKDFPPKNNGDDRMRRPYRGIRRFSCLCWPHTANMNCGSLVAPYRCYLSRVDVNRDLTATPQDAWPRLKEYHNPQRFIVPKCLGSHLLPICSPRSPLQVGPGKAHRLLRARHWGNTARETPHLPCEGHVAHDEGSNERQQDDLRPRRHRSHGENIAHCRSAFGHARQRAPGISNRGKFSIPFGLDFDSLGAFRPATALTPRFD
jgi:hypothetical protein